MYVCMPMQQYMACTRAYSSLPTGVGPKLFQSHQLVLYNPTPKVAGGRSRQSPNYFSCLGQQQSCSAPQVHRNVKSAEEQHALDQTCLQHGVSYTQATWYLQARWGPKPIRVTWTCAVSQGCKHQCPFHTHQP